MLISDWSSDVCSSDLDLDRHHLRVAEQRVLVLEQRHGGLVEREVQLLVDVGVRRPVAAGAVARDQVADVGVGDGDEVAARRIERVQEQPRLPGQRPAVAEHLPAAVREVAQERSEEHTSELQSLMRTSYAVFCLKKKKTINTTA